MFQTLSSEPLPPSRVHGSHRPQWFDPVVARAMAKRPDDRFATAMEFKHALMAQASEALGLPPIAARVEAGSSFIELQSAPTLPDGRASDWQRGTFALGTQPQRAPVRPSQWHAETLQMLESELAQSIGPLARVLVQRAARSTGDLMSLRQTLAEQIDTEAGRDQFLQRTRSRASSFGTLGSGGAAVTTRRRAADDTLLGDQVMRVAELALTQHVGPVARVIVSRAASRAASRDEFFKLLAQHVEDEDEREELLRTLESSSAGR
jgi:serine/threonine-protein kinase